MPLEAASRLGARLRRLGDAALALLQTRVELLGVELQLEVQRIAEAVLRAALALLLIAFGLFFAVALLVVALWETHRLEVLGSAALLFLGAGLLLLRDARARLQPRPGGAFAASVDELAEDRAGLDAAPPPAEPGAPTARPD